MENQIQKAKVTQDFLYEYLTGHSVNLNRLNELMGVSNGILMGCFRHNPNRLGKPMSFSQKNIVRLNAALDTLAAQIKQCIITFGSDQTRTNNRGTTYDPAAAAAIVERLSPYFKLTTFTNRVLGWNAKKKDTVLSNPSSKVYGNITSDDVARINAELLAIAGMLGGIEVVADEGSSSSSSDQ